MVETNFPSRQIRILTFIIFHIQQSNGPTAALLGQNNAIQPQQLYASEHSCSILHLPYNDISLPFTCRVLKCKSCAKGRVPDVLFTTVEPPKNLEINGRGCLLQAKILRMKRFVVLRLQHIQHILLMFELLIHTLSLFT